MSTRYGTLVMMLGSVLVLAAAGCDGGGDGTGGGGSGGGGGGTGGDEPQAPVILPPNSSGQSCQNGESSCDDQAAIDEYADCAVTTCDAEYRQCFGDDYLAGTFGGPCQPLMECAVQCQDCDQPCLQACSDQHLAGACQDCITGPILDCVVESLTSGTCKIPCGPTSSAGVCDDLKACCDSLADPQDHDDCIKTHGQVKLGGDQACQSALDIYVSGGSCQ